MRHRADKVDQVAKLGMLRTRVEHENGQFALKMLILQPKVLAVRPRVFADERLQM